MIFENIIFKIFTKNIIVHLLTCDTEQLDSARPEVELWRMVNTTYMPQDHHNQHPVIAAAVHLSMRHM